MGTFKFNSSDLLKNLYPELEKIKFFNKSYPVELIDKNLIYPYYSNIFSNSKNNNSIFYHFSNNNNFLIPFYVVMGIYSSIIKKTNTKEFENLKDFTEVFYNSSRHNFYRVNFDSHQIELKGNIGHETISFESFLEYCLPQKFGRKNFYKIKAFEKKDEENFNKIKNLIEDAEINLSQSIEKYLKIIKNKENFIPDSGIIFFTKKSNFKEYIRNLFINDTLLKDLIPVYEAKSRSGVNYSYQNLSTGEKDPIIIIADHRDINALEIFREKYPYLNNLIIDDFDSSNEEHVDIVKKSSDKFKNIFLISNNNNFNINKIYNINKNFDSYKYWFTSDLDFKDNNLTEPLHKTFIVRDKKLTEINEKFKDYQDKFKALRQFCSNESLGEIIKINCLFYDIKIRFFSFNKPESLENSIEDFKKKLNRFWQDNYLYPNG